MMVIRKFSSLLRPEEIGDAGFAWTQEYGNAVRIKGFFGVESDYLSWL